MKGREGEEMERERERERKRERERVTPPHQLGIKFFIEDGFIFYQCHPLGKPTCGDGLLYYDDENTDIKYTVMHTDWHAVLRPCPSFPRSM